MATEREKIEILAKCKEVIQDIDEFEQNLQKLEAERGLPPFHRSKPLVERLKDLGLSREAIEQTQLLLTAIEDIVRGK
jgi:hypothetical protein